MFNKYRLESNVANNILNEFKHRVLPYVNFNLCNSRSLECLVSFFIRCKIYFAIRFQNEEMKTTAKKLKFKSKLKCK